MGRTWKQQFKSALYGMLLGAIIPTLAFGQATLLPNAKQQYLDDSANPVAAGQVFYYVPNTSTKKTVWQDSAKTTPQANPVQLDAAGRPQPGGQTYGDGVYRQVVKDQDGNTIWDAVTSSTNGGSSGTSPAWSEGVMVGTIIPWANMALPAKYLYAAGQAIDRASYPDLKTAITFSTNILCTTGVATITVTTDISDKTPIGAPIEAVCFAPGTTVISKSSGQLTMSSNATTTISTPIVIFPWGNGNGATTFNVPNINGRVPFGRNNMNGVVSSALTQTYYGTNPNGIGPIGGLESTTLGTVNFPPYTPGGLVTLTASGGGNATSFFRSNGSVVSGSFAAGSTTIDGVQVGTGTLQTIVGVFAGSPQGGANTPISRVPPGVIVDYLIKALPDDLPAGPGVTSLQGMTGSISCGYGLTCTAQTISVNIPGGLVTSGAAPITYDPMTGIVACPTCVTSAGTTPNSVFVTNGSGVPLWATTLPAVGVSGLSIGGGLDTISGGRTPSFLTFTDCVRPEQYGALRDGVANDTSAVLQAANAAAAANIGLCLTGGGGYSTTAMQFGVGVSNNNGTATGSGTFRGSIAGTTLTVDRPSAIDLSVGQSITGVGVTAGTRITGFGTGKGQLGTYTVNVASAVGPITMTAAAPVCTGSISGTTYTVASCANGALYKGMALTGTGVTLGTTIVAGTNNTTSGVFTVDISQTVASTSIRGNSVSVANMPKFIKGDDPHTSQFISRSTGGPYEKKYITYYGPVNSFSPDPQFGLYWKDFTIKPNSYTIGLAVQGQVYATVENITVIGSLGCGFRFIGNNLTPVIYAHMRSLTSRTNGDCGFSFDGNDGQGNFNLQAVDMAGLYAQGNTGDGFVFDYANTDCIGCSSESNTGRSYRLDHVNYMNWTNIYSEANAGGGIIGTANTRGVLFDGQMIEAPDTTTIVNCTTCRIKYFNGTNSIDNYSQWTAYTPTFGTATGAGTTFTLNSARWTRNGKVVTVIVDYNITAVGTGGGATFISVPFTAAGFRAVGSGISYATNVGRILTAQITAGTPGTIQVLDGGPATAVLVNSYVVNITYEIP